MENGSVQNGDGKTSHASSQLQLDKKPNFCKVCDSFSFLACIHCGFIYCSSECFWNAHQLVHLDASMIDLNSQVDLRLDQNSQDTLEAEEEILDAEKELLMLNKNRGYEKFVEMTDKDPQGFSFVKVTAKGESVNILWVKPQEHVATYGRFKQLQKVYESDEIPSIPSEQLESFQPHLVMVHIDGKWSRARILSFPDSRESVKVVDIDSGIVSDLLLPGVVKVVQQPELDQPAFAFKVVLVNCDEELAVGDLIKIRLTQRDGLEIYAEVEVSDDDGEDKEDPLETTVTAEPLVEPNPSPRTFATKLQMQNFTTGPKIPLTYCSGSKLGQGKFHVCEYKFLHIRAQHFEEIKAYAGGMQPSGRYKPFLHELVLAKRTNGQYHRGVCVEAFESECNIYFIDFGDNDVGFFNEIVPMPESLAHVCYSQTVDIKFSSNRSIADIDVNKTRKLMANKKNFTAKVDKKESSKGYVVTLDPSLAVFKK